MTSLTTMFVVGPNEYVEFNETMGSKAFLEHVWDQSSTPLDSQDVATGHLHSAGARIAPTPPPRIEFPTVFKIKGKGNTYKPSGKYISWDDLARLNPLAVKPPPSLEEYKKRGAQVGSGLRLKPGELLMRDEPMAKVKKQLNTFSEEDGWIGGSSESIYSVSTPPLVVKKKTPDRTPKRTSERNKPETSESTSATKSKSLLERLGLDELTTSPPKDPQIRTTPSPGIHRPGAKIPSPLLLTSPARNPGPISLGFAHTPLSAAHPPPETPLKHTRNEPQTPATPHHPASTCEDGPSGLGLGLTPHKPTIPLLEGLPIKETAGNQIEAMLERLRKAKSGLGTGASMWAPKPTDVAAASEKLCSATRSGAKRKPGHRHTGLQLSMGQEIDVMQNLDEKAEDELSSRMAGDWLGNLLPPTPVLGCDSPEDTPNSSTGFWGSTSKRNSLLPSMEENWSGDDDDQPPPPPANLSFKSRTPSPLSPESDADADGENEAREKTKSRRKRGRRDSKTKETGGLASAFGLEQEKSPSGDKTTSTCAFTEETATTVEQVPSTPKVESGGGGDTSFTGLDWAADDSDLSDTLPDLDDWGITITPSKSEPLRENPKPSPLLDGAKFSMHAPTGPRKYSTAQRKSAAPPAATPYGRWKSAPPPQGISIKGVASRQPAPVVKKERPAVRPRVAADSGAFARLMGSAARKPPPKDASPPPVNGKKDASPPVNEKKALVEGKKPRGRKKQTK